MERSDNRAADLEMGRNLLQDYRLFSIERLDRAPCCFADGDRATPHRQRANEPTLSTVGVVTWCARRVIAQVVVANSAEQWVRVKIVVRENAALLPMNQVTRNHDV